MDRSGTIDRTGLASFDGFGRSSVYTVGDHALITLLQHALGQEVTDMIPTPGLVDDMLIAHSELRSRRSPPRRNIRNVQNWFHNNDGAIVAPERAFIEHSEDLISLRKTELRSVSQFLTEHVVFRFHWLWKKESPVPLRDVDQPVRRYVDDRRIETIAKICILVAGLAMLVTPLWVLAVMQSVYSKLAIITVFIVIFLTVVALTTVSKPAEILAATAA
jgi:hypothetical protein